MCLYYMQAQIKHYSSMSYILNSVAMFAFSYFNISYKIFVKHFKFHTKMYLNIHAYTLVLLSW